MTRLQLGPTFGWLSLFSGYGGLDEGVRAALGGHVVALAEYEPPTKKTPRPTQAAARVLAHRYPGVPNLGDVTAADFRQLHGMVHGITAGFPCQDVSHAGLRTGMHEGTRSGLWSQVARAIDELQPALVMIENVPGLRTARAGDPTEVVDDETASDMEPDAGAVGDASRGDRPVLRAFGAVLGDLAERGYDAEWISLRASDVGAPHRRERVFILAYRRDLTHVAAA